MFPFLPIHLFFFPNLLVLPCLFIRHQVLMGDQNAGKSTFLHAFTYNEDERFLEMSSLLPVLSASFVNTRFLTREQAAAQAPMDELPFLDTDIGRGASFTRTHAHARTCARARVRMFSLLPPPPLHTPL